MSVPRFFVGDLRAGIVELDEAESRHARSARRLIVGDEVALFDGVGHEALGYITAIDKRSVSIQAASVSFRDRPRPTLTLAVALPKGPRQDTLIEKLTELGVTRIIPLTTSRSVSDASEHRVEKFRRTAIEAAKQSSQAWLPTIDRATTLDELAARFREHARVVVAAAGASERFIASSADSILACVGPEGDWSPEELDRLRGAGAQSVCLGPNVLRVETAAIALASIVHAASA